MAEKSVLVDRKGNICTLTLNRPQIKNALSMDIIWELQAAFDRIAADKEIRVVILEGAGGEFCAGGDMSVLGQGVHSSEWMKWMMDTGKLITTMRELPQIIVCKLQGHALGGGATLLLAGDFIVAVDDAKFGLLFVNYGAILEAGAHYLLPKLVGLAKARELALLGEVITGEEAASIGLVYKSVPPEGIDDAVAKLVGKILKKPLAGQSLIKRGLEAAYDMPFQRALEWEAAHQSLMLSGEEHKMAIKQFLSQRARSTGQEQA